MEPVPRLPSTRHPRCSPHRLLTCAPVRCTLGGAHATPSIHSTPTRPPAVYLHAYLWVHSKKSLCHASPPLVAHVAPGPLRTSEPVTCTPEGDKATPPVHSTPTPPPAVYLPAHPLDALYKGPVQLFPSTRTPTPSPADCLPSDPLGSLQEESVPRLPSTPRPRRPRSFTYLRTR